MSSRQIHRLAHEVVRLSRQPGNLKNAKRQRALLRRDRTYKPLVFARPTRPFLSQKFNLSLKDAILDPEKFLEMDLLNKIAEATEFDDDTWISPVIDIWPGVVFEATLFGVPWEAREDTQCWFGDPILDNLGRVDALARIIRDFDFNRTGMMRLAHDIYQQGKKLVGKEMKLIFPRWYSGNLRIALKLRGDTNLYLDFCDDAASLKKMMNYITQMRRKYEALREENFPSEPTGFETWSSYMRTGFILGNDEVDGNIFSAQTYRNLVYPSDLLFCKDHRKIYFHSCGNLTPMFRHIKDLPHIFILHVSSLSDFARAVEIFGDRVIFEKAFSDWDPTFNAIASGKIETAEEFIRLGKEREIFYYFMVDVDTAETKSLERINNWIRIMKNTIDRFYRYR